jgi:hypothetical protein
MVATSVASAGTVPNWGSRREQPHTQTQDSRDSGWSRRDSGKRSSAPDVQRVPPSRSFAQPNHFDSDRGERRYARDPRPNFNSDDSRRGSAPDERRVPPSRSFGPSNDGDRGERRYARDPRPNVNSDNSRRDWGGDSNRHDRDGRPGRDWQGSHDNNRYEGDRNRDGDDRHWSTDRNRDRDWDRDRDRYRWRDNHGRYWTYDRGWYDRYRADHYRYHNGRYYSRERFSIGLYYAPWGYSPRFWLQDWWLPVSYYDDRYLIYDFWRFDLYEPPYGCRWIRVGGDALLVDRFSGDIVDVVYDLFW